MNSGNKRIGDVFSQFHPVVGFLYFVFVIGFGMFFLHPFCLLCSLICSFTYSIWLNGKKAVRFNFITLLPLLAIMALVNPAFNHEGATILFYLESGNPVTLESIYYGIASATMIVSVVCWFSCYNVVMSSDKLIYIFGRILPSLSLLLAMTMRFVPRFKKQIRKIADAQRCLGKDISYGSAVQRMRQGWTILSVMMTWALENSIETSDSMKSRGYGLPNRSSFSIYKMDKRDKKTLAFLIATGMYILIGAWKGGLYYRYFPTLKMSTGSDTIFRLIAYLLLALFPIGANIWHQIRCKNIYQGEEKIAATDQFTPR